MIVCVISRQAKIGELYSEDILEWEVLECIKATKVGMWCRERGYLPPRIPKSAEDIYIAEIGNISYRFFSVE